MGNRKNQSRSRKRKAEQAQLLSPPQRSPAKAEHQLCVRWLLRTAKTVGYDQQTVLQLCQFWRATGMLLPFRLDAPVERMRGGGLQLRVERAHEWYEATEAYLRFGLVRAIGEEAAAALQCQGMTLHCMQPGDGPQPPHADLPLRLYDESDPQESAAQTTPENQHAASCWSVLLYAQDGPSTQLQTFTAAQHDRTLRSAQAQCELLVESYFIKMQVDLGSVLVMRGDVWHSAPRNDTLFPRVCVYGLYSSQTLDENPAQMTQATWPVGYLPSVEL